MERARVRGGERRGEGSAGRRAATAPRPADEVLDLQRSAGNRAVSGMLARAPDEKEKAQRDVGKAKVPGIGTITLIALNLPAQRAPGTSGPREIVLSSYVGSHSAELQAAMIRGRPMDIEIVRPTGPPLKLKGAVIASYYTSTGSDEPVETWSLDFDSIEHERGADAGGPDAGRGRDTWDVGGRGS